MPYNCYLKKRTVYIPTSAKMVTGVYIEIEPVAVVTITDTQGLRRAFLDTMARGNPIVPKPQDDKWPPPVLLKYAGAQSWSAFMNGTAVWTIKDYGGNYQIAGRHVQPRGNAPEDPQRRISLPHGSTANDAVDRMIEILQDAASK
jgi:hypothetical protein